MDDFMVHLEDLSLEELQKLVDDEQKINEFIMDDDRVKRMKLDREMALAENRSIADDNLGKEPKLLQLKVDLGNKYSELKELHECYQTNQGKLASLSKEENLDSMLAILQAKLAETEEKTENLAEMLFKREVDTENFISQFKEVRKQAHLRRAKIDKMRELILEIRRNGVHNQTSQSNPSNLLRGGSRHGSVPSVSSQPVLNNTPYPPQGGYNFPHPGMHASASYPQTYQPYPSQQYQQYQWSQ